MGQRLGAEDPAFVAAKRCHNRPHRVTGALQTCFTDMFQLWTFMFQMIFFFISIRHIITNPQDTVFLMVNSPLYNISISTFQGDFLHDSWMKSMSF